MKIIHLIDTIKAGGAENVMLNYIRVCNILGHSSTVIGKPSSKQYEKIIANDARIKYSIKLHDLKDTNIIFVHSNHKLFELVFFKYWLVKYKIRVIYIQHLNYAESKYKFLSYIINWVCTDFIKITPIIGKLVNKYIKIPTHDIVNFSINKYESNKWYDIRQHVREELNISANEILIMFSAIFKPGKGLKEFINIARSMQDLNKYRFLVLGDGVESNFVEEYEGANLIWLGRKNDVERYLIASDIYVFTSKFPQEMMPMALIEAINVNKYCLAYSTEINNYLLGNQTFIDIDKYTIINDKAVDSSKLVHYDREYGIKQLENLINIVSRR